MVIENLSILDYLKYKDILKECSKRHFGTFNIFKLRYFKKLTQNKDILMLWLCEKVDFETIELKEVLFVNNNFSGNLTNFDIISKEHKKFICITEKNEISDFILNNKNTNLILRADLSDMNFSLDISSNHFKKFDLDADLKIRCDLQNNIFYSKNRIPLQEKDIIYECRRSNFIPNLAYFLKIDDLFIGYGQVLLIDEKYYVANFGILDDYRHKGYGRKLLSYILIKAKELGLTDIYIKVDKANEVALNLYLNTGFDFFKELNIFRID